MVETSKQGDAKMTTYNEAEWDAKIEAAAARKDRKEVERLMVAQQDAFLEAYPLPSTTK